MACGAGSWRVFLLPFPSPRHVSSLLCQRSEVCRLLSHVVAQRCDGGHDVVGSRADKARGVADHEARDDLQRMRVACGGGRADRVRAGIENRMGLERLERAPMLLGSPDGIDWNIPVGPDQVNGAPVQGGNERREVRGVIRHGTVGDHLLVRAEGRLCCGHRGHCFVHDEGVRLFGILGIRSGGHERTLLVFPTHIHTRRRHSKLVFGPAEGSPRVVASVPAWLQDE
eukprot:scaffold37473_cov62-Phaeocystis_antarctica.AAC.1